MEMLTLELLTGGKKMHIDIKNNLVLLNSHVADFEKKYHRQPGSVKILAASKSQSIEKILDAYQAGQRIFGENYLQEALAKMAMLADKHIEWHFIGPIQSNKTRKIAENFTWVHSVDSIKIAKRLNDQRPANLPALNICIEVNVSAEESKSGVKVDEVTSLIDCCQSLPRLALRGFMTIPAPFHQFEDQRREFHKLFFLWNTLRQKGMALDMLSMGMSDDFEAAIAEGSTMIRIGTAIFGKRS